MTTQLTESVNAQYDQYVLNNYGVMPRVLVRGEGARVWDSEGRRYLDFLSGIATNTLGHCAPEITSRLEAQMHELVHCSNLFRHEAQGKLAAKIVEHAGDGRVYFCNSGTEANEALIKLARRHGLKKTGQEGQCYKIVCADNAFHGRTFGGMSATPKDKVRQGYGPLLDGFVFAERNNLASFEATIDENTAAVFIETIQGEGGIFPFETEFFQGLRALCDKHDLLLMLDEVQCGIGRTGKLFAYQHHAVKADALGMAKGLGGGFPIGAMWIDQAHADLMPPGSHGSTFGGGPLACTAALAVIETIEEQNLLQRVQELSKPWEQELEQIVADFPILFTGLRGIGYMRALVLKEMEPPAFVALLAEHGLLTGPAGYGAVRLLPPLNASEDELSESIQRIRDAATAAMESAEPTTTHV